MRSLFLIALIVVPAVAQRLPLPERTDTLPGAAELFLRIRDLTRTEREAELFRQVMAGNVPRFLRTLAPVTVQETVNGTLYTLRYYVTPDYLSLGSDSDHMLMPMTPLLAQRIADRTGSLLPTPRMSDQIYAAAPLKLRPQPIPPDAAMDRMPRFLQHDDSVSALRRPLLGTYPYGTLVAGHKKDVVIDPLLYSRLKAKVPRPVVIYGWHKPDGVPIQPAYNGHGETYADYSHGIRLVQERAEINGAEVRLSDLLTDERFALMLSDTALVRTRYDIPRSP